MMIYLTGATNSIVSTNWQSPQTEVSRSLGGYVSSTPAPNNLLNGMFDLLSMQTIKEHTTETVGLALVNRFIYDVKNVTVQIKQEEDALAKFQIAIVPLSNKFYMEHIDSRYSEPLQADWYDANEPQPIADTLKAGSGFGIWLRRYIPEELNLKTDEELVEEFLQDDNNVNAQEIKTSKLKTIENVQIVFNYQEDESAQGGHKDYSADYDKNYS